MGGQYSMQHVLQIVVVTVSNIALNGFVLVRCMFEYKHALSWALPFSVVSDT